MSEKFGISNLKIVVAVGIEMGNVADVMGRTKGAARYFALMSLTDELFALQGCDFSLLDDEIKDLSEVEGTELNSFIAAKFDIASDRLESVIERALTIVKKQADVIIESIDLAKYIKAETTTKEEEVVVEEETVPTES